MVTFLLAHKEREFSNINMLVSFMGKKYKRSIGESIDVKLWNGNKNRVKVVKGDLNANLINENIDKMEVAALNTMAFFKDYNFAPDTEAFFDRFDKERYGNKLIDKDGILLLDYFRTYIERHSEGKSVACVNKYNASLSKFLAYEKTLKRPLYFKDVNIDFYNNFRKWFFAQGFSVNYFGNVIKVLKQIYREAKVMDKLHDFTDIEHKDFVSSREDSENIYLSDEELLDIYNLDITIVSLDEYYNSKELLFNSEQIRKKFVSYNLIRDRFLIGCYTGLRVSDFGRLKDANVDNKFIRIRTKKTDTETIIPISTTLRTILERNDLSVTVSDQKINKHIKEICRMVGMTESVLINKSIGGKRVEKIFEKCDLVCTHTARRSFATNAYKAGVPTIAIMKITGHTKESTFLKYIKVSAEENAELLLSHPFFK